MAHINNDPPARLAIVPEFNDDEISAALAPCHLDRWWSIDVNQLDLSVLMDDRLLEREMSATAAGVQQSPTWSSSGYSSCGDGDILEANNVSHQPPHHLLQPQPQRPECVSRSVPKLLPVELYCVCNEPAGDGHMIACDSPFGCPIEWFHFGCVNMKEPPKGDWVCPLCKSLM